MCTVVVGFMIAVKIIKILNISNYVNEILFSFCKSSKSNPVRKRVPIFVSHGMFILSRSRRNVNTNLLVPSVSVKREKEENAYVILQNQMVRISINRMHPP